MTQGRNDGLEWVSAFMVSYSMDALDWIYVTDHYGKQKVTAHYDTLIIALKICVLIIIKVNFPNQWPYYKSIYAQKHNN